MVKGNCYEQQNNAYPKTSAPTTLEGISDLPGFLMSHSELYQNSAITDRYEARTQRRVYAGSEMPCTD